MNAKKHGAIRTGRASRVRAYLAKLPAGQHRTARQIADAVEPGGDVNHMSASLSTLTRAGHVVRINTGHHRAGYSIGKTPPPAAAKPPRRRGNSSQTNIRKALRNLAGGKPAKPARNAKPLQYGKQITQRTNFPGALSTTTSQSLAHASARQKITADTAAFLRNGGKIERLGTTQFSAHFPIKHEQ